MTAPPTARLDPNDVAPLERLPEAPVGEEEEDELEAEAPLALGAGVYKQIEGSANTLKGGTPNSEKTEHQKLGSEYANPNIVSQRERT